MSAISPSQPVHARISGASWAILALMVVSVAINYIDRTSLSTAAPLLVREPEMEISAAKLGVLLSAFSGPTRFCNSLPAGWWIATACAG